MPLVIQFNGPYAAPTIVCDYCEKEITAVTDGNYQWSQTAEADDGAVAAMYFTHKACCDAFEHAQGDPYAWNAIGLECLPYFLAENLQVSWQEARAKARRMAGL